MSKIERYNYEEAYDESAKMRKKIEGGAVNYDEAEKSVESEKVPFSREIYLEDGTPEPEYLDKQRRQKFIEKFIKEHGNQNTSEWKEFLDKIDFSLLREIFSDLALRHGIPKEKVNFIGLKGIVSHGGTYTQTLYDPAPNIIMLGNPNFRVNNEYLFWDSENEEDKENKVKIENRISEVFGSLDLFRLLKLIHEEVHAISKNIGRGGFNEKGGHFFFEQNGFRRMSYRRDEYKSPVYDDEYDIFSVLCEAVVEKLAREILLEYLEKSNWSPEEIEVFRKTLNQHPEELSFYSKHISALDSMIKKLASNRGVSEEEIWDFFKKGSLEGEKFEDSEKMKMFEDTFDASFLKRLAYIKHPMFAGSEREFYHFRKKYNLV